MDKESFYSKVYKIVESIPKGNVMTYGQIAFLIGKPNYSRMVGKALKVSSENIPSHRVVNSQGRLVPSWKEQKDILLKEGIKFKQNGCVDLKQFCLKFF